MLKWVHVIHLCVLFVLFNFKAFLFISVFLNFSFLSLILFTFLYHLCYFPFIFPSLQCPDLYLHDRRGPAPHPAHLLPPRGRVRHSGPGAAQAPHVEAGDPQPRPRGEHPGDIRVHPGCQTAQDGSECGCKHVNCTEDGHDVGQDRYVIMLGKISLLEQLVLKMMENFEDVYFKSDLWKEVKLSFLLFEPDFYTFPVNLEENI